MNEFIPDTHKVVVLTKHGVFKRTWETKTMYSGTHIECISYVSNFSKNLTRDGNTTIHIKECDADDISEQKLLWYVEKYTHLIRDELAADSQVFHGQSENYPDLNTFVEQLKESLLEEFAPAESPMEMGWVGSNGLP